MDENMKRTNRAKRTKDAITTYEVSLYHCSWLGPLFGSGLLNELENGRHYVIEFDESLNKVSQTQQMNLTIRFWDIKKINKIFKFSFTSTFNVCRH